MLIIQRGKLITACFGKVMAPNSQDIKGFLLFAVLGLMETAFIQQVRRSSLIVVHGVVHQFLQISGFQHKMIPPHRLRRNLG